MTRDATEEVNSDEERQDWTEAKLDVAITKLKDRRTKLGELEQAARDRHDAILGYLRLVRAGRPRITASSFVGGSTGIGVWLARSIRTLVSTYLADNKLSAYRQGRHAERSIYFRMKTDYADSAISAGG